jgi:hypothetical protein
MLSDNAHCELNQVSIIEADDGTDAIFPEISRKITVKIHDTGEYPSEGIRVLISRGCSFVVRSKRCENAGSTAASRHGRLLK